MRIPRPASAIAATEQQRYRPAFDGLRALAVLAVMTQHFVPDVQGGFIGVDVFFLLSGYLITALLLEEHARWGKINLAMFYIRRGLRLLPGLAVLFVLGGLFTWLRPLPLTMAFPWILVFVLGYVGNFVVVASPLRLGYLNHTWSLAIEEQFYLLWPLALGLLLAKMARVQLGWLLVMLAFAIGILRAIIWLLLEVPAIRFVTPLRADGLLLGAALACALPILAPRVRGWLRSPIPAIVATIGLGIGVATLREIEAPLYLGGLSVVLGAAAVLLGHVELAPDGVLARILATQPLPAIGRISYGLYLFHFPVALFWPGDDGLLGYALKIGGTFGLAISSYLLIERRALGLKAKFRRA